jgi:hypothetical protein
MKRLILLVALVMALAVLAPAAFADDVDDDAVEMEEKDPSVAQQFKAEMIADYFAVGTTGATEVEITDVETLRSDGETGPTVGWGVVFKLMLYDSDGVKGEGGWAIGLLRKIYLVDPGHDKIDLHKNFGQLQKENKPEKPEKATPPGQLRKAAKAEG